jgi:hypothetical protein
MKMKRTSTHHTKKKKKCLGLLVKGNEQKCLRGIAVANFAGKEKRRYGYR